MSCNPRHSSKRSDDSEYSDDSVDEKPDVCKRGKPKCYASRATIASCINRFRCRLACFKPSRWSCYTFLMVFGVLFAAFLYFYGLTLMYQVMRLVRIMIHSLLPASWLMSTSDIVNQALYKYNADRVGLADYALESAGGSVICNSDTYHVTSGTMYSVFGLPLWYHDSDPREVIRPDVQPGKCWAMHGTHGFVTIGLAMPIVVTAVSLEHIPKELATSGKLDSAPNEFLIVGQELTVDSPEVILGRFTYKLDQDPIQVFQIKDSYCQIKSSDTESCGPNRLIFRIITLKVQSNYGNSEYTCIYRLRVHGTPMPQINRF